MHRRARDLGVLPHRHYSFYVSGCVLPPPQSLDGPITSCRDRNSAGSQNNLLPNDPGPRNSIHPSSNTFVNPVRTTPDDEQLLKIDYNHLSSGCAQHHTKV
uniref:Uncharacterized protein n=1 Tax=Daphnia galeata TaxID=27404 RepID=A0A8J2RU54_9CRUS|nr:unnamed protein product [Daphnia galeata]